MFRGVGPSGGAEGFGPLELEGGELVVEDSFVEVFEEAFSDFLFVAEEEFAGVLGEGSTGEEGGEGVGGGVFVCSVGFC